MALKRFVIDGFGQLELNQVAFPRDGRIEAQCALGEDFGKLTEVAQGKLICENGMILAVDRANRQIVPVEADNEFPVALNYTAEHMYDERKMGLKNFYLEPDTFYPRMGFPSVGELWTSNCVCYDDAEFTNDEAVITAAKACKTTALYGATSEIGAVKLTATKPEGFALKVVEATTMPDGQFAVKFQVLAV